MMITVIILNRHTCVYVYKLCTVIISLKVRVCVCARLVDGGGCGIRMAWLSIFYTHHPSNNIYLKRFNGISYINTVLATPRRIMWECVIDIYSKTYFSFPFPTQQFVCIDYSLYYYAITYAHVRKQNAWKLFRRSFENCNKQNFCTVKKKKKKRKTKTIAYIVCKIIINNYQTIHRLSFVYTTY